jgi:hypothetical protein
MILVRIPRPSRRLAWAFFIVLTLSLGLAHWWQWEKVIRKQRQIIERLNEMANPTWKPI